MLLLHTLSTCADAGPDLCTFCPDLCTLCPDLCTLRLWCYSSIKQRKYSTCTHGGGHWLQPVLVEFFLQPLMQTLLEPVVVSPVATCAGGLFPSTHWRTYSTCAGATCTVWWWSVVVVYRYIHTNMKPYKNLFLTAPQKLLNQHCITGALLVNLAHLGVCTDNFVVDTYISY